MVSEKRDSIFREKRDWFQRKESLRLSYRMKARTQEIDGFREKRVWFQRKERLVSKKRESAIEI
jgi:hypothetical protein